jgi:hypothetical protein
MEPETNDNLSIHEKARKLPYLVLLKQQRAGLSNGRGCGCGQHIYQDKEDVMSPLC